MNPLWLLPVYAYFLIGLFSFLGLTGRWKDPWPWDKAFAFCLLWLPCSIFVIIRGLLTGIIKLVKEEVL